MMGFRNNFAETSQNGAMCRNSSTLSRSITFICQFVLVASLAVAAANPATSQTVVEVLEHDALLGTPVSGYAEYEGSLFYSDGSGLFRLDSLNSEPVRIPLPTPPGWASEWGGPIDATFMQFDGALFFHAWQLNAQGNPGSYLHRISSQLGQPELIDVPEEPNTPEFDWMNQERGYADGTREFAVLDGRLYFFASRVIPDPASPGGTQLSHALFRLDSAEATPKQIDWLGYVTEDQFNPSALSATRSGLLFKTQSGVDVARTMEDSRIYQIQSPRVVNPVNAIDPPSAPSYAITSGAIPSGDLVEFGGSIFYSGQHSGFHESPNVPDPGPFPRPSSNTGGDFPRQIELYRYNRKSGIVYFDLHSISEAEAIDRWNPAGGQIFVGSSSPSAFVVADNRLYFTAYPDGSPNGGGNIEDQLAQIYRMSSPNGAPEPLLFRPQVPFAQSRVFGEFGGRIWLWTDTGTGQQIHYLTEDGTDAVPVQLPTRFSSSAFADGFVEFGDYVVFWVYDYVETVDGTVVIKGWTYAVRFDDPDGPEPRPKVLQTKLLANGGEYPDKPGLIARVNQRIQLRCNVTNNSDSDIRHVRIRIGTIRNFPSKKNSLVNRQRLPKGYRCRIDSVASGETRSCTVVIRVRPGAHRYRCAASSKYVSKKPLRSSDSVWIAGRGRKKK